MHRPESDDLERYGGQAVVEGVMMRSRHYFAVACRRRSTGSVVTHVETLPPPKGRSRLFEAPFLRGTLALVDAFGIGYRTLIYAANLQLADTGRDLSDEELVEHAVSAAKAEGGGKPAAGTAITGITIGLTSVVALLIGYALFWILPAALSDLMLYGRIGHHAHIWRPLVHGAGGLFHYSPGANLLEGCVRIVFFLAYLAMISRLTNVRRVFEYHGAEHKAINTLEAGLPLDIEHAMQSSRIHPRCGTNFIFIVLITSMFVFSLIPRAVPGDGIGLFLGTHLLRLALLPVVAGISYEVLRFAGSHRNSRWAQFLIAPGLATQLLTTREPDEEQMAVALASLQAVIAEEHAAGKIKAESAAGRSSSPPQGDEGESPAVGFA